MILVAHDQNASLVHYTDNERWSSMKPTLLILLLLGLSLPFVPPAEADEILQVTLNNMTFAVPETVNASFDWDVTANTISNVIVDSSNPFFSSPPLGSVLPGGVDGTGTLYAYIASDGVGDGLQILNDEGCPNCGVPPIPGTYNVAGDFFIVCETSACKSTFDMPGIFAKVQSGTFTVAATPEPSSLIMLCGGLLSVALLFPGQRRKNRLVPCPEAARRSA
jgi:hypothetical protein